MSPEIIIGVVIAGIVVLTFVSKLLPKSQPKAKQFKCSRCGTFSPHTERTIEAWRNNKTKFYCQACHAKWLQSRPPQEREQFSSHSSSRSGCLGIAEDLGALLARTIRAQPQFFLQQIQLLNVPCSKLKWVLNMPGLEYTDRTDAQHYEIEMRKKALRGVTTSELVDVRDQCLKEFHHE